MWDMRQNAGERSSPLQRGFAVSCTGELRSPVILTHDSSVIVQENKQYQQCPPITISRIMKQFKGSITKQIGYSIWQKSFHDHIIRNDDEYLEIWRYIDENPLKWQNDCYFEG